MKNIKFFLLMLLFAFIVFAFTNLPKNDNPQAGQYSYSTIAFSSAGKNIYVYYGGQNEEVIKIEKGENVNNKIVDLLNTMNEKGYELATSSSHAFNYNSNSNSSIFAGGTGNYIEFYYTLRKKN